MTDPAPERELKLAKARKGEIARQFKHLTPGSQEHQAALAAMQAITAEIKAIEARLAAKPVSPSAPEPAAPPVTLPLPQVPLDQDYPGPFDCRLLRAEELPRWTAFIAQRPGHHLYQQAFWGPLIKRCFGHERHIMVALTPQGEILGGLPWVELRSRLFGQFGVSMPYFNYGGLLAQHRNVAQALLTSAQGLCASHQLSHIEVRSLQPGLWPDAYTQSKKVSMILPLPDSNPKLDDQLGAKVRAQVKKALGYSPRFALGGAELLDDFYRVFAQNMRDLGTPVYSKTWFSALLAEPALGAQIALVYFGSKPVATGFLIKHGPMLEIPWASTLKSANHTHVNMWLYRQILGAAIDQGYAYFDFGRSTKDAGTYQFKKQWGAQPHPHYWYYLMPPQAQLPQLNPDNPKYRIMIAIWQRLPVWLTRLIGPPLVANLP